MMDRLLSRILQQAQAQADQILDQARNQESQILHQAQSQAQSIIQQALERARAQAREMQRTELAKARVQARMLELRTKHELVEQVIQALRDCLDEIRFKGFKGMSYFQILQKLIEDARKLIPGDYKLWLSPKDREFVQLDSQVLEGNLHGPILISLDGKIKVDFSLERRLELLRDDLRKLIAEQLWG